MSTLFVDVDTQLDFVYPAGSLYVPGAEMLVPLVQRLHRHALQHNIPILSTADNHAENDPEFTAWPPHCVRGTTGQQKPQGTLLQDAVVLSTRYTGELPDARQYVIEKQSVDCFTNHNMERLLLHLAVGRCVVYGVVTEVCVLHAARGLLQRGIAVELLEDAIQGLAYERTQNALAELRSMGAKVSRTGLVAV